MKTIEQKEHRDININYDEERFYIYTESDKITIENESIPTLIQALLPEGKAIIDVPKGAEIVSNLNVPCVNGDHGIWIYLKPKEVQEPFIWPEHLPDGTRVTYGDFADKWQVMNKECTWYYVDTYNSFARPEDRITIPDWLVKEPRTIIKGESA